MKYGHLGRILPSWWAASARMARVPTPTPHPNLHVPPSGPVRSVVRFHWICWFRNSSIHWLVVDLPLWKWWTSSVGMMTFPIYGKIKFMFQTTNQMHRNSIELWFDLRKYFNMSVGIFDNEDCELWPVPFRTTVPSCGNMNMISRHSRVSG